MFPSANQFDYQHIKIPRKPSWSRTMTADQVDRREIDAFLEWRREVALMESSNPTLKVTPFEKNLEVWRQLWRVIERCDMAVQVVDARNPLMFFTEDLARYAAEQQPARPMLLLVNKSDLLTDYQRRAWARHFDRCGIRFAFYSAHYEQEK
jgi:large subunit GTPase 1